MNSPTLKDLQLQLIDFANARNWGQFHSPNVQFANNAILLILIMQG